MSVVRRLFAGMALGGLVYGAAMAQAQAGGDRMPPDQMAAETHVHKPSPPSTSLVLSVDGKTKTLTLADLQAMPQRTVVVHNAHTKVDERYSGVAVSDLLAGHGISTEGAAAKKVYHSYLRAEGTDHYWVVYSASEVEGALHKGEVIVALMMDGKPLGEDGKFKLVASEEQKPARWVRNLSSLTFVTVE